MSPLEIKERVEDALGTMMGRAAVAVLLAIVVGLGGWNLYTTVSNGVMIAGINARLEETRSADMKRCDVLEAKVGIIESRQDEVRRALAELIGRVGGEKK